MPLWVSLIAANYDMRRMQLQAMRVSGLIGAPCCGRRCLLGLLFKAVVFCVLDLISQRGGGSGRGGKDGRKKENLGTDRPEQRHMQ